MYYCIIFQISIKLTLTFQKKNSLVIASATDNLWWWIPPYCPCNFMLTPWSSWWCNVDGNI